MKLDLMHITSCRNVISIEHAASAVSVVFWLVDPFKERKDCYMAQLKPYHCIVLRNFQHTKLYYFQNLSLGFIRTIFLRFCKFQPHILIKWILKKKRMSCQIVNINRKYIIKKLSSPINRYQQFTFITVNVITLLSPCYLLAPCTIYHSFLVEFSCGLAKYRTKRFFLAFYAKANTKH